MRLWNEFVAVWGDIMSLSLTAVLMILAAIIGGLLWFFWPRWYDALRNIRFSREAKRSERAKAKIRKVTEEELRELAESAEELPEVDAIVFTTLADRLAAEGRYAEAVRERLRAMVRELVQREVITHHPGWTVTELAREAGAARPPVGPPVDTASGIFSDIWYAKRPALSEHDARMRGLARELDDAMARGDR